MAKVEIDGKSVDAENGKMIIEVADDLGIYIPRFCYHKKLSVAANCRMCLVEVENNRKTVPACATPITDGMKVFTRSKAALHSQRTVMEFLLINHPLDCPICDQGGECELQDLSMGFGADHSSYQQAKRAVADEDLGSLISTEMTRCIHCTRCVRFGEEVAGFREMGATGRGEDMQIGTYIQHGITSEVSANIIDLCPVGALTSKPFRFQARAWEMTQHESIAPHDCLGSNVYLHTRRNQLMRVVPKDSTINETWLSDRDRFSYRGLQGEQRLLHPKIRQNGEWVTVDWQTALNFTVEGIKQVIAEYGPEQMAALASPSSTLEELYLLQKWMRGMGVHHLDHRLQQSDFRDQDGMPVMPESTLAYADLEHQKHIILLGCNVRREVPLVALKIRKAAMMHGGQVYTINPIDYDYRFPVAKSAVVSPKDMVTHLAQIARVLIDKKNADKSLKGFDKVQQLLAEVKSSASAKTMADALSQPDAVIVCGALLEHHPDAAILRLLVHVVTQLTQARVLWLTTGANSAGAWLTGMVPHRLAFGKANETPGLDAMSMWSNSLKGYFLLNVDPMFDTVHAALACRALKAAKFVVKMTAFDDALNNDYAHVLLPIAPFAETSGTYINLDQQWQSFKGALSPQGEARPAWKILRVLGHLAAVQGFDYESSVEVLNEIKAQFAEVSNRAWIPYYPDTLSSESAQDINLMRVGECPLYRCDAIVRHSQPLQSSPAADRVVLKIHPKTVKRLKLSDQATVTQGDIEITLPVEQDERVALDVVWLPRAIPETAELGHAFSAITIKA